MGKDNITYYLDNYLDTLVQETLTLRSLTPNYLDIELDAYFNTIDELLTKIKNQDNITSQALNEFINNYQGLKLSFYNKLDYIKSTADTFNKLNKTYDTKEFSQIETFSAIALDNIENTDSLFLTKSSTNFNLTKEIVTDNTINFYNSNSNFHTAINITGVDTDYIDSLQVTILLTDGTVKSITVHHEEISENTISVNTEAMISVSLKIDIFYKDNNITNKMEILEDIFCHSSLYTYQQYGTISLNAVEFQEPRLIAFNQTVKLPADTYINYSITINDSLSFTIPVGNSVVCKRASVLNSKEVKKYIGLYKDNMYFSNSFELSDIVDKENTFVVYLPKLTTNVTLNNMIKIINDSSFKFLSYIDKVNIKLVVELISFDPYSSPSIKNIVGYVK